MLSIEDQIDNATVMIKTADFIENQLHKLIKDGGAADEFGEVAQKALEDMREIMKREKIIR